MITMDGRPIGWAGICGGWGGLPVAPSPHLRPSMHAKHSHDNDDPQLRSAKAVTGYHIQTHEGTIGHVADFAIDGRSWAICHLIVTTGHWFSQKEIALPSKDVERISYEDSKVFVNVTKEAIQHGREYHVPPAAFQEQTIETNARI